MTEEIRKHEIYREMLRHLRKGWVRYQFDTLNGVCLVGALERALVAHGHRTRSSAPSDLERRYCSEIAVHLKETVPRSLTEYGKYSSDRNRIIAWNDANSRRKDQVISAVEGLAKKTTAEWKANEALLASIETQNLKNRVQFLEQQVAALRSRITELETELATLRQKKKRGVALTADIIAADQETLAELDAELDGLYATMSSK